MVEAHILMKPTAQKLILFALLLLPVCGQAADFAVTQSAAPTSNGGTQDFTSSGFGTPACALFFGGYGTANGTTVSNAGLWIGTYDGTNQAAAAFSSENGQTTTDTGALLDTTHASITALSTDQTLDGSATASWITDGARLTWADAPPSAYLINSLLVGGSGVSNCATGSISSSASLNGTASVSTLGFTPDVIIAFSRYNDGTEVRLGVGFAWKNGGAIVQRAAGMYNQDALTTSSVASVIRSNRLIDNGASGNATYELTSFDAGGFTITTRDSGVSRNIVYLAIKLNGISAWLGTSDSPTATGNNAVTGVGWRPQAGLMLHGEWAATETYYVTDDGETYGLSAFTAGASGSSSIQSEDGAATSDEKSVTDTKACRLRKDGADFAVCTLSSFDADGLTFNYTTAPAAATKRALLLFQAAGGSQFYRRRDQ